MWCWCNWVTGYRGNWVTLHTPQMSAFNAVRGSNMLFPNEFGEDLFDLTQTNTTQTKESSTANGIYVSKYREIRSLCPQCTPLFTDYSKQNNHSASAYSVNQLTSGVVSVLILMDAFSVDRQMHGSCVMERCLSCVPLLRWWLNEE